MDLEILSQLKQQHRELFAITIAMEDDEQEFIFRAIGREEYRVVLEEYEYHKDITNFQEDLCQFTVVYPPNYKFHEGLGGVAEILSDEILNISGLFEEQGAELLMMNRANMQNFDYQIECVIHEAFPEHSLDEIGMWDMRRTMYFFARAEWILTNLRGIDLRFGTHEELQQQQQEYRVHKEPGNDFSEVMVVPDADYETNPEELVKMKPSELNDHQKQIAEQYTYRMISKEAYAKGSKVGEIEKTMENNVFPELGFFKSDFELGR